jgi:S-adenosylmethionine hydrolase
MTIITLLTDFGEQDGFIGMMKGVILSIAPQVTLVDITHQVEPQDIRQGAFLLAQAASFFPPGTIHVAVVDPGVGTARRPIALRLGGHTFVGPDNGLFTLVLQQAEAGHQTFEAVTLDKPEFWLPVVTRSFHGRDIFAPVAAHLAMGKSLTDLGTPLTALVRLTFPAPQRTTSGWQGEVISIDHFGNLITNLDASHLGDPQGVSLIVAGNTLQGISQTFGERAPGELIAMIDSSGQVSVAVVNGNAARLLGLKIGAPVTIEVPHPGG